ncbi:MAG: hypothetical protein HFH92_10780 [Lachnospiraceae bacterium]|uniref:hypothetical protein n=1 Tax=uncultured Acetatifactor sp. TaxID=1671927 RepID=UPI0026307E89|nr:hypothetical protein [uncultured Acetatifactor sp.]MCI8789576.1 hypothetical protein [Lachnospiraceae bacterium]
MTRQIRLLTKLSLYGMFGWNEFLHTKDGRKKLRCLLMGGLWMFLVLMLAGYVCLMSVGLVAMGMGYFVPAVLGMSVSLVVFFFTMVKAGPVLFDRRAYERQVALPVTDRAIIVSRFLSMYLTNMLLGMVVMVPGMAVYGVMERPGAAFYLYGLVTVVFLPLLPLTAASVVGALIAGIASRWRRKNLASILLTLVFMCVLLIGSMRLSSVEESQMEAMLQQIALQLEGQIRSLYPPAIWIAEAMVQGKLEGLLLFLGLSLGCFLVFLEILQHFYGRICGLLSAREAKGNYRMERLQAKSVMRSLVEREWRRYFSSAIYVTNTLAGEVLMVLLAVAVPVVGKESVDRIIGIPGVVDRALPILLGALAVMMPLTACSISMEGKQWWMMQTLPIRRRDMIWSKVILQLLVALPFYLVSEAVLLAALGPGWADALSLLVVPWAYILFGARAGIAINEKLPVFNWDSEVRVVKQSSSTFVTMLAVMAAAVVPVVILFVAPDFPVYGVHGAVVAVLAGATLLMEACGRNA